MNTKDAATAYRLISKGFSILADAIEPDASSVRAQEAPEAGRAVVAPARPDEPDLPEFPAPFDYADAYPTQPAPIGKAANLTPDQVEIVAGQGSLVQCPAHRIPFKDGKYGKFCPAQSDEPNWSNDKGYCRVTPKSAVAWLRQHAEVPA